MFTNGKYHVKNLDLCAIHAFIEAIDDDYIWSIYVSCNRGLKNAPQWIDDKCSELCYKWLGKEVRVIVDHGFHECSDTWDDSGDLVGDGSNELLGTVMQRVGAEEETLKRSLYSLQSSAIICAMADFPTPVAP